MRPEHYADEYRRYQTYVRNFGANRLYKIACGPRNDDYHWTEVLMERARDMRGNPRMHGLSLHYYTPDGPFRQRHSATQFGESEWIDILKTATVMDDYISKHVAIMDQYDPDKQVELIVDEWGTWYAVEPGTNPGFLYQQNSLRDALVAALTLNIFNRHCERVTMANIAQTINVLQALILTDEHSDRLVLTPTYHIFEMYKVHHDATLLPLELHCDQYTCGDDTMAGLSVSASRDKMGVVYLSLCNLNANEDTAVTCELRGMVLTDVQGRVLSAPLMQAHNTFDMPDQVQPTEFRGASFEGNVCTITLPARSVVVLACYPSDSGEEAA
jgi:alpha-N-arabinofuranosidase